MYVKITDIDKGKVQVISNMYNFVKVIPHIVLYEIDGALIAFYRSLFYQSPGLFFVSDVQIRRP